MVGKGVVAMGRVVLSNRERRIIIGPMDLGLREIGVLEHFSMRGLLP
jgi:non-homologous end joining protein Ku